MRYTLMAALIVLALAGCKSSPPGGKQAAPPKPEPAKGAAQADPWHQFPATVLREDATTRTSPGSVAERVLPPTSPATTTKPKATSARTPATASAKPSARKGAASRANPAATVAKAKPGSATAGKKAASATTARSSAKAKAGTAAAAKPAAARVKPASSSRPVRPELGPPDAVL